MQIYKFRDLTIIDSGKNEKIVIACDSCCGIGEMENDIVRTSNEIVGYFSARVCIFELLAFRAYPNVIVNNLGMPMEKYGENIIKGINKAIKEYNKAGFSRKINLKECLTGSTEDNIKTLQTFLGLTIIGEKGKEDKKKIEKGENIFLLGIPKVGEALLEDIKGEKSEIISFKDIKILLKNNIKEILPIGSKGALYEIGQIERSNSVDIELEYEGELLKKSAGPSTALLFVCNEEILKKIKKEIKIPLIKIGTIR